MRLLVCGDRNWTDKSCIFGTLDEVAPTVIISGGATGADDIAEQWAVEHRVERHIFPAQWDKFGKAAGPIRNQLMLDAGQPDLVLAFHADYALSKGTKDMVRRARKAGLTARVIS
jgi:hypothetical protein